jgi:hypothetical protein
MFIMKGEDFSLKSASKATRDLSMDKHGQSIQGIVLLHVCGKIYRDALGVIILSKNNVSH